MSSIGSPTLASSSGSADQSAGTPGTTTGMPQQGIYQTTPDTLTNNQLGIVGIDANRNQKVVGNIISGSADQGAPVKIGGKYNASPPTLSDGNRGDAQLDVNGNLQTRESYQPGFEDNTSGVAGILMKPVSSGTYAPSTYMEAGSVTKANIKNAAGNVYSFIITNANAAVRYFQLHNKASAPAGTETAQLWFLIPAGTATAPGTLIIDSSFFAPSERFTTGIGWAISTTSTTFTDSATAGEHFKMVRYV